MILGCIPRIDTAVTNTICQITNYKSDVIHCRGQVRGHRKKIFFLTILSGNPGCALRRRKYIIYFQASFQKTLKHSFICTLANSLADFV